MSQPPKDNFESVSASGKRKFAKTPEDRYEVRKKLGSGGMATVYDAVDMDLRRHVAVKILKDEHHEAGTYDTEDRPATQRFIEEAQITGQLEHPNIISVHEIGYDASGRLFFTMKKVDGLTLGEILDLLRTGDKAAHEKYHHHKLIEIFIKICDAIRFAHDREVLHRDLKPDNIMVGRFGEVQVMDWGLAKIIGAPEKTNFEISATTTVSKLVSTDGGDPLNTIDGTISGTPAYMPPEQARGETTRIDHRADIFLLGAMLYELITLIPPYTASSSMRALRKAQKHELPTPQDAVEMACKRGMLEDDTPFPTEAQERAKTFPKALAAIAMKAAAEEPVDRYQSVKDLADDIRAWRTNRPVSVFCESPLTRLSKLAGRHRAASVAIAAFVLLLLLSLSTFAMIKQRIADERAESSETIATANAESLRNAENFSAVVEENSKRVESQLQRLERRDRSSELNGVASDTLWRASKITNSKARHAAMLAALDSARAAAEADRTNPWAEVWIGKISFDLGRVVDARVALLNAMRLSEEHDASLDFATLLTTATVVLSEAVIYSVEDEVFVPLFVEVMNRAAKTKGINETQLKIAELFVEHMPRGLRFVDMAKDDPEYEETRAKINADALRLRSLRKKLEVGVSITYWELLLIESWHEVQGWGYSEEELLRTTPLERMLKANSLLDRALEIRPQLAIAWCFKSLFAVQVSRALHQESENKSAERSEAIKNAASEFTKIWVNYAARFPTDAVGHYYLGESDSRLFFGRHAEGSRGLEHFEHTLELDPSADYARASYALILETLDRPEDAGKQFEALLNHWSPERDIAWHGPTSFGLWRTPLARFFDFNARREGDFWTKNIALYERIKARAAKKQGARDYYLGVLIDSANRYDALASAPKGFWQELPEDGAAWLDLMVAEVLSRANLEAPIAENLLKRAESKAKDSDPDLLLQVEETIKTLADPKREALVSLDLQEDPASLLKRSRLLRTHLSVPEMSRALVTLRDRYLANTNPEQSELLKEAMVTIYLSLASADELAAQAACDTCPILSGVIDSFILEESAPFHPSSAR